MPFDTTYHIVPNPRTGIETIAYSGGKDTDIYLAPGQMPPHFDSLAFMGNGFTANTGQADNDYPQPKFEHYRPGNTLIGIFVVLFIYAVIRIIREADAHEHYDTRSIFNTGKTVMAKAPCISYPGEEIDTADGTVIPILNRHFPYYGKLSFPSRQKFLQRLKRFAAGKTFKIHDTSGFREMPILISATAVQLSFGLEQFLLPSFRNIHIYPQEFLGLEPGIRFLEGNVSGQNINISWKHFMEGFQYPDDGQNVGLHEMAHAYYYQNFNTGEHVDNNFVSAFPKFNVNADKAFEKEKDAGNTLYSDYALRNFQEFWAESIEIFFEKPAQLSEAYPQLYMALKEVLNQDPLVFH